MTSRIINLTCIKSTGIEMFVPHFIFFFFGFEAWVPCSILNYYRDF